MSASSTRRDSFKRLRICALAPGNVTPYTDVITVCFTIRRSMPPRTLLAIGFYEIDGFNKYPHICFFSKRTFTNVPQPKHQLLHAPQPVLLHHYTHLEVYQPVPNSPLKNRFCFETIILKTKKKNYKKILVWHRIDHHPTQHNVANHYTFHPTYS